GGGGHACGNGSQNAVGVPGTANTGGGGGAGGRCASPTGTWAGGTGGSGIVKIAYNDTYTTTPVYTTPGTYAYSFWYFQGGVWTKAQTVNVTVTAPVPSCTLSAPSSVNYGSAATLTYTTSNATSATIDQGVGSVSTSQTSTSSQPITASPTVFTMTVNGLGGTNACSVPVTVNDMCGDISGFQSVAPASPCLNSVTQQGQCVPSGYYWTGSACAVIAPPPISIGSFFGPGRVRSGNTAVLKYTVTNPPASCTITGTNGYNSGPISPVSGVQGSATTTAVTKNTTFTLTCGTVSLSTNVGVTPSFQEQ
ncbi:MAG TPA: hypothetical protein VN665_02295, partial [Candidatus Paceibacterota bacterium]|nr:hypothetical protein [Candidatus Paceibacterota bacterium]